MTQILVSFTSQHPIHIFIWVLINVILTTDELVGLTKTYLPFATVDN